MVQQYSASESTKNNSQKSVFYSKDTVPSMEWTEERQEILRDLLSEQVANEEYYQTLDEPHGISCNCTECN